MPGFGSVSRTGFNWPLSCTAASGDASSFAEIASATAAGRQSPWLAPGESQPGISFVAS